MTLAGSACEQHSEASAFHGEERPAPTEAELEGVLVPPPPLSEGVFPCTDCHDPEIPVNTQRRAMKTAHAEIRLEHDEEHRWCLDCHDAANRDMLHLASGAPVPFEESYRLCGQCHGDKYRDWRAGIHGRRSGRWDGVKTCPVGATWQEPDGIVVVDSDWCIGCRCCMSACPYGARHFNWGEPGLPAEEMNQKTHYLGNRPRPQGVVEKCTFCIHRVREGLYPACVEVCPVGARKFGDLNDPDSEIRYILQSKRVFVLKSELNTLPRFYYFFGA